MAERGRINHLDLTVKDAFASFAFYDAVLSFMGYAVSERYDYGFDWNIGRRGDGFCSVGIRNAVGEGGARVHDRYSPGLHHVAWEAASRDDVDALHRLLLKIGVSVLDGPAVYPEYGDTYYAVFFADPDGLKLEYVYWP